MRLPRGATAKTCAVRAALRLHVDGRRTQSHRAFFLRVAQKASPRQGLQLAKSPALDPSVQHPWDPESEYIYFCPNLFEGNCLH